MAVDALVPNDPRVEHKFTQVPGGHTYHYMLAKPQGEPVATVVLIHGWPDLGMGWRYQVPFLLSLNLQVVVPDMLGYGQTSAPEAASEYTMKKLTAHVATVIGEVTDQPIILGGHDWGGFFIWRMINYYPQLVRAIFSLCVPYMPPTPVKVTLEQMVKAAPNFKYQLQLASPRAEQLVGQSRAHLEGFLRGLYGGRTPEGEPAFGTDNGVNGDVLTRIGPSPIVDAEMMEHYVSEYARHGLHGPCNWYRTRELNADDEVPVAQDFAGWKVPVPAMVVMAEHDAALPPRLADGQEKWFAAGLKREVIPRASHWVMVQCPEETNRHIGDFIKSVLGADSKAAL